MKDAYIDAGQPISSPMVTVDRQPKQMPAELYMVEGFQKLICCPTPHIGRTK